MNEEEKRAINALKQLDNFDDLCETCYYEGTKRKQIYGCNNCREEAKDIIISLVEKLQKENEELKDKNKTLEELLQGTLYEMYKYYRDLANSYQANCISKEKVKDKIEELEKDEYSKYYDIFLEERDLKYTIQVLQELLEES